MKKLLTMMLMLVAGTAMSFAQDTWTVAGSSAALNGITDWATDAVTNDMSSTDGVVYTLTVTGCTLEKDVIYQYKVVKNHAWGEAYPSSNKTFTVDETAVYTVVYTFNSNTKEVSEEATKTGEAGEISHTYTVAGDAQLCEAGWNAAETANDMTETSTGVFTWTKENVLLSGGNIGFKVCTDHTWTSYPVGDGNNWIINSSIDEYGNGEGYYDVTITFVEDTKEITVAIKKHYNDYTVTFVKPDGWTDVAAWFWDKDGANYDLVWPGKQMTDTGAAKDGKAVYTVTLSTFKTVPVGVLFNNNDTENTLQTSDFTFENNKQYEPVASVSFTMTKEFESFSSKYALDFSETSVKAYRADIEDGKVKLYNISKVPANTGVILKGAAGEVEIPTTYAVSAIGTNLLVAANTGVEIAASTDGSYNYVLATQKEVQGFYQVTSAYTMTQNGKAYLHTTTALADEATSAPAWIIEGDVTGIESVTRETITDNAYYNLAGQRVAQPTKGLYIVNGKKVIVK